MKGSLYAVVLLILMAFDQPAETPLKTTNVTTEAEDIAPAQICSVNNHAFKAGEVLTYKLYYNWNFVWVAAGEVEFRVRDQSDMYQLSAHGSTYSSYEWFYKVRDKYDTFVDKETMLPIISIRDIHEGKYRLYDKITFDRRRNVAESFRGKSLATAKTTKYDIEPCMHDILSIIYSSRNVDFNGLNKGDKVPVKIFVDKKTWPIKVTYRGRDSNKKIKGQGRFRTIQFSPRVGGNFYFDDDTEMKVWVSDDKNRIPLMIESPLSVGSVKAVLKDYKGLKHELSAMVEKNKNTKDDDLDR